MQMFSFKFEYDSVVIESSLVIQAFNQETLIWLGFGSNGVLFVFGIYIINP